MSASNSSSSAGASQKKGDSDKKEAQKKMSSAEYYRKKRKEQERKSLENTRKNLGNYLLNQDCTPLPYKREITFKIIVAGDYGVGKTSIIRQYVQGQFSSAYKLTIGADFSVKCIDWDEKTRLNLQIWDIAGSEKSGQSRSVYYRYAVGAMLVFDLTRPGTFDSIVQWLNDIRDKVFLRDGKCVPIVLVANKEDMVPVNHKFINYEGFCKKNNILGFCVTSAKYDTNIRDAMHTLISQVYMNHITRSVKTVSLQETPEATVLKSCAII